ncbi:MAG TPA: ATP-dependent zinc metalloprotease FtsH [Thermoleophilaceae bacterium]|nr:ATP-dependent zinc metalloprotease FtsH [Thermoleophilaceae bacterium]
MADATQRKPQGQQDHRPWRVEGHKDQPQQPQRAMPPPRSRFWWFVVAALILNIVLSFALSGKPSVTKVPYTLFYKQVQAANVSEISSKGQEIQGDFKKAVAYPPGKDAKKITQFQTVRPDFGDDGLTQALLKNNVTVNAHPVETGTPLWQTIVFGFGPTLLLVGLFIALMRRGGGAGGMLGSFGRTTAKRYEHSENRTTFKDVAGIEEAEQELMEVVDFLRNPQRYLKVGGAIPKGVLLAGAPGTGKTLLARAVAGEADVPFFSISASEFIEAIVGVGASRVRDLFRVAKEAAPAIIFIDELDAIGRSRGGGVSFGGNDEREQTLNQILTEMDGFTGAEGVIVLAATNRPEILDQALLRPGRFDRRVFVNPPDKDGRKQILSVHTRSVPLADDVDLAQVAASTPGMVGADLRNLVNEAALTAARRNHERVHSADFSDALEKIVLGTERRITLSPEERERTAYHESGHAVLGMLEPGADPVRKVSIIPRGQALGVTFQSPESDRYGYGANYLRGRIVGALGGRAAEQIVYGDVTTGAESDLEQVTGIARQMVGRWGMSDAVGLVSVLPRPGNESPFPAADANAPAESTRELVDAEVRRIVDECYSQAIERLQDNRHRLDSLAQALLEHETLDEEDAYRAAGFDEPPQAAAEPPATVSARDLQ